jgi:hypothetical protein
MPGATRIGLDLDPKADEPKVQMVSTSCCASAASVLAGQVNELISALKGEWQSPQQCQRMPARDLGLLIFHA